MAKKETYLGGLRHIALIRTHATSDERMRTLGHETREDMIEWVMADELASEARQLWLNAGDDAADVVETALEKADDHDVPRDLVWEQFDDELLERALAEADSTHPLIQFERAVAASGKGKVIR